MTYREMQILERVQARGNRLTGKELEFLGRLGRDHRSLFPLSYDEHCQLEEIHARLQGAKQ